MIEKPQFIPKSKREELRKKQEQEKLQQEKQNEVNIKEIRKEYNNFKLKEYLRKKKDEQNDKQERNSKSRSRSHSKERQNQKDKYVTSNTRARERVILEGEDKQLVSLKNAYLGLNREKKKLLKPSEKFKNIFNFDWDPTDDTSIDTNPLYTNKHESAFLFGRGLRAGVDVREQKKSVLEYERLIREHGMEEPSFQQQQQHTIVSHSNSKSPSPEPQKQFETNFEKKQYMLDTRMQKEKKYQKLEKEITLATHEKMRDIGPNFHWSHKNINQMSERDWRIFREDYDIIIKGGRVPIPIRDWSDYPFPQSILDSINKANYKRPTPIQMQALPIGLQKKDMIGIAPTGSGKSAAYLIPMIIYLKTLPPMNDETAKNGPYGLVLAPSRELVIQIDKEFKKFSIGTELTSNAILGGRRIEDQAYFLRKGQEVLIATPGRLKDALMTHFTVLSQVCWVIIDEADKMIDMGFEEEVNYILDQIPKENSKPDDDSDGLVQGRALRVTHLYSATMSPPIEAIAKKYLRQFCYISIGEPGGGKKEIDQKIEMIQEGQKKRKLQELLQHSEPPIIIFVNQKRVAELLQKVIEKWSWKCVIYHGSKTQDQRESAVNGFKSKRYDILIATDLAQRGLDVEGVKMVINFDAPKKIEDYIHRIGRTGRAEKRGYSVTFLTPHDEDIYYDLKEFLVRNDQEVPQELAIHPSAKIKPGTIEQVPRRKQILYVQ